MFKKSAFSESSLRSGVWNWRRDSATESHLCPIQQLELRGREHNFKDFYARMNAENMNFFSLT